jgi:hypothetical protein
MVWSVQANTTQFSCLWNLLCINILVCIYIDSTFWSIKDSTNKILEALGEVKSLFFFVGDLYGLVHTFLSMFFCVLGHVFLLMFIYWCCFIGIHLWMHIYRCCFVGVHLMLFICYCFCANAQLLMFFLVGGDVLMNFLLVLFFICWFYCWTILI